MKKALILLGAVAGAAAAVKAFNEWVYSALIHKEFYVPEALSSFLTESNPTDKTNLTKQCKQWIEDYGYEKHYMTNEDGSRCVAYYFKPEKPSDVYVFASHGYRSDGKGEWCYFAEHYVKELGFNMFVVDHQAAGDSEGKYVGFGSFEARDGIKWLEYMNSTFGKDIKIFLHGISMGSATVMLMTGKDNLPENVRFTVADCGYTSALDEFTYKLESLNIPTKPLIPMVSKMNLSRAGYDFAKDTNALEAVSKAKIPMLFIHGGSDKFVPTYMVNSLFDACSAPYKDKLIVEGADHAESYMLGKEDYEKKLDEFIEFLYK